MPLWRIFAHPDTFTLSQRAEFAADITDYYVDKGLPAFYVNVLFIPLEGSNFFIGGTPRTNFVRIAIEHIAVKYPDADEEAGRKYREGRMDLINQVLKRHIADRGDLDWEHHISETPRDLWRVQGLVAPPLDSEEGEVWRKAGRPVAHT